MFCVLDGFTGTKRASDLSKSVVRIQQAIRPHNPDDKNENA